MHLAKLVENRICVFRLESLTGALKLTVYCRVQHKKIFTERTAREPPNAAD